MLACGNPDVLQESTLYADSDAEVDKALAAALAGADKELCQSCAAGTVEAIGRRGNVRAFDHTNKPRLLIESLQRIPVTAFVGTLPSLLVYVGWLTYWTPDSLEDIVRSPSVFAPAGSNPDFGDVHFAVADVLALAQRLGQDVTALRQAYGLQESPQPQHTPQEPQGHLGLAETPPGTLSPVGGLQEPPNGGRGRMSTERRGRGGRPPVYNWDKFWIEIVTIAHTPDGLPGDRDELQRRMMVWCATNFENPPDATTVSRKLKALYDRKRLQS